MTLRIRDKLVILITIPLTILLALVGIVVTVQVDAVHVAASTRIVTASLETAQQLLTTLVDGETGMRGYVATGLRIFAAPYDDARSHLDTILPRFAALAADPASPPALLADAQHTTGLAHLAFSFLDEQAALMRAGKRSTAGDARRLLVGKRSMDAFRISLARYMDDVAGARSAGVARSAQLRRLILLLSLAGAAFALAATLVLYVTITKDLTRRLRRLEGAAVAFAAGDQPALEPGGADEIAAVYHSFAEMCRQLESRREALQRYELLAAQTRDVMIFADADGRIIDVNSAATATYGYAREELLQLDLFALRADDGRGLLRMLERARAGEALFFRSRDRRKDGKRFPVEVALNGAAVGGGFIILCVIRDITKREADNAALVAARDRALHASRLKSEFVATMSHEIRTPMNAVIGMNELLLSTQLDDEQRDLATTARESGRALLAIIDDILDFSKIEAGFLTLEKLDFDLARTVESAAAVVAVDARRKGLTVTTYVDPAIGRSVRGDAARLRQVLLNLLGNAVKFSSSGAVEARAVLSARDEHTVTVQFSVRDAGIGIAPESLAAIFEPFRQADGTTTRRHGGTGLGLSISRRLVALMGGALGVTSVPGSGSTFTFAATFETAVASGATRAALALTGERILIVARNRALAVVLKDYVSAWHLDTVAVASAEAAHAALAAVDATPYRIVLVESVPDDAGLAAFVAQLRAHPTHANATLVAVGDAHDRGLRRAALDAGFAHYLASPVTQSALYDCIAGATARPGDAAPADAAAAPLVDGKILLVEDHPVNQRLALQQLKKLGFAATAVGDGLAALEELTRASYDLVLMDCHMPVMDGYAATRAIREREARTGGRIPIVAMTANARPEDRADCIAAGMDDCLVKPVDLARIGATLRRWLPEIAVAG